MSGTAPNWRNWFARIWPRKNRQVLQQYAALKVQAPLVLTDIALRGGIYAALPPDISDPFRAGVAEGRRQLALETIKLAEQDFDGLLRLIEPPAKPGETNT